MLADTQSGATPRALLALLLFKLPSVFTLRTLLELDTLGERSHQLRLQPLPYKLIDILYTFVYLTSATFSIIL